MAREWFIPKKRSERKRIERGLYPCRTCLRWKRVPDPRLGDNDQRAGFYQENDICQECTGMKKGGVPQFPDLPPQERERAASLTKEQNIKKQESVNDIEQSEKIKKEIHSLTEKEEGRTLTRVERVKQTIEGIYIDENSDTITRIKVVDKKKISETEAREGNL